MSEPTPTYTYAATRGSNLDRARELLGGTDVSSPETALRSDEDILAILGREGFARGVAWLASGLLAEFAQQPVRVVLVSGLTVDYSALLKAWEALAAPLRADLAGDGAEAPPARTTAIGQIAAGRDAGRQLR